MVWCGVVNTCLLPNSGLATQTDYYPQHLNVKYLESKNKNKIINILPCCVVLSYILTLYQSDLSLAKCSKVYCKNNLRKNVFWWLAQQSLADYDGGGGGGGGGHYCTVLRLPVYRQSQSE